MTGPQASYLQTLRQQADREAEFDSATTKAEASKLIDRLRQETGRSG